MDYAHIQVEPLNPRIGAEVSGVDLARLDDPTFKEIHQAWLGHQVLVFRDQELSIEQHKALGRRFGDLHIHPAAPAPEGHPEIMVVHADANSKTVAGYGWHSDVSCDAEPPMASILYLTQVPPDGGGDTLFSNMYAAYDALSDEMKDFLGPLTAIHGSEHVYRGRYGYKDSLRDGEFPRSEHPVVRTHPETGRKALYVNSGFTTHIRKLARNESRAVLDMLLAHVQNPEFQCRVRWRENTVTLWDNRCVQHLAVWDYRGQVRHGHRVTIQGDRPS